MTFQIPMNLVLLKNISIVGIHWGAYTRNEQDRIPEVWAALLQLVREGRLRPVVFEQIYQGLESLPKGLKALGNRETWGKAVLRIRPEDDNKRQTKL
jgi:NADPH2:quinone reductase